MGTIRAKYSRITTWTIITFSQQKSPQKSSYAPLRAEKKGMMHDWISVGKELPAPNVHVLCCTNWGKIVISSLQEHGRWSGFKAYSQEVLYWQPLPPVPKKLKNKLLAEVGYAVRERNPFRRKEEKQ